MVHFFQTVAAVLLAVILVLVLKKGGSGIGELLTLAVCAMVIIMALKYIGPIFDFIRSVEQMAVMDNQILKILLKSVGVSVTAEIAEMICNDAGNQAMGKTLQLFASVVVICICVPMMNELLELMEGILGGI